MKYVSAALAGLFAVASATKLNPNKISKRTLLKNAIPVDKNGKIRQLEENGWEISPDYSIQFSACTSLKVFNDELFDEDIYDYAYDGSIVAQSSFVLFNVCQTEYCGYESDDNLYMTTVGNYMQAAMEYNKRELEDFCEACEQTCQEEEYEEEAAEEEEEGDEEGDEEEDGEDRRLRKSVLRKLANYVDCDECEARAEECEEVEEGDDDGDEPKDAFEWLENLGECQETGAQWNDVDLFAGFICNEAGDGVEIALFLDEDCSIYTKQSSFSSVMSNSDSQFLEDSSDIVLNAFKGTISCEYSEYDDPNEDGDEDEYQEEEANEFCKKVMEDDATSLQNCGEANDERKLDEEDEAEEEEENAYEWYEYDITNDDVEDAYTVCTVIQEKGGEYTTVYDSSEGASGTVYDYHKGESSGGSTAGKVFIIIIIILAALVVAYYCFQNRKKTKDDKSEPLTQKEGSAMA